MLIAGAITLAGCSRSPPPQQTRADQWRARSADPRLAASPSLHSYADSRMIRRGGGTYKVGAPYQVGSRWYYPREEPGYDRTGVGSWYGEDFHGRRTANGETYDMRALTAAHPTLPMPSYAWVSNLQNGRTILVRINDRGPYAHDRVIDLSRASAQALGFAGRGLSQVRVRYAGPAPLNGDDRREWAFLRQQRWFAELGHEPARPRTPYLRPTTASAAPGTWRWW